MYKIKVAMVGPQRSGKTVLANFLSDAVENPVAESYRPTHVVRVLEFESSQLNLGNRYAKADVELWDCGGDTNLQGSWPALARDAHGVIFVFNPEKDSQARDLDVFHAAFAEKPGLTDSQCVVLANYYPNGDGEIQRRGVGRGAKLSPKFSRIPQLEVNMNEEGNRLRTDFNTFLSGIINNMSEYNNQEEINIMNMRN